MLCAKRRVQTSILSHGHDDEDGRCIRTLEEINGVRRALEQSQVGNYVTD